MMVFDLVFIFKQGIEKFVIWVHKNWCKVNKLKTDKTINDLFLEQLD